MMPASALSCRNIPGPLFHWRQDRVQERCRRARHAGPLGPTERVHRPGIGRRRLGQRRERPGLRSVRDHQVSSACKDVEAEEAAKSDRVALDDLLRSCPEIQFADQVTDELMIKFGAALRKQGKSARTVFNRRRSILGFLRWCDVDFRALKIRTPRFERSFPLCIRTPKSAPCLRTRQTSISG